MNRSQSQWRRHNVKANKQDQLVNGRKGGKSEWRKGRHFSAKEREVCVWMLNSGSIQYELGDKREGQG